MSSHGPSFVTWYAALEARHTEALTFQEVRRSLQAMQALYTQGRDRLPTGAALEGRGKRAAFALAYAPLHYLVVEAAVAQLGLTAQPEPSLLCELGCGTGVGAAAWARSLARPVRLLGVDTSAWALQEARWTWAQMQLQGTLMARRLGPQGLGGLPPAGAYLLAYVANELDEATRASLLPALLAAHARGAQVLVIEPVARGIAPFWATWAQAFAAAGGREHELRVRPQLPPRLALLRRAARLHDRELVARCLVLA